MKGFQRLIVLLFSSILFTSLIGCVDEQAAGDEGNEESNSSNNITEVEEEVLSNQFDHLQKTANEYLQDASFDTITARDLYEWTMLGGEEEYIIVDVRATEIFSKGHIEGAINIPYKFITQTEKLELLPKDKKIILVCFGGNQASHTAALWSMIGYDTAILENGMGSWTNNTDLAPSVPKDTFDFELVTDEVELSETYELPTLQYENVTNVTELLKAASQAYLESGKSLLIPAPDLKEKVDNGANDFFIVDIRSKEDYQKGHIPTAYNIPVNELAEKENLENLPTNKQIVLVGYNAYDANQANRILNFLGYDAVAMSHGMRIWHSDSSLIGITPISEEKLEKFPVRELNYDVDGEAAEVGCS